MSSGLSGAHKRRTSNLKHNDSCFHHLKTMFSEGSIVRQLYLNFFFFLLTRFLFWDELNLFHIATYRNRAVWFSIWCHFLEISTLFSSFVVLWRSRSRRRYRQLGYIVPASWELPIWIMRTAVSIICKLCLWKATLSDKLTNVFYFFD